MNIIEVIGIDVGKLENDARIHTNQKNYSFENNPAGFKKLENWMLKNINCPKQQLLIAFEHTGLYSHPLSVYLTENQYSYIVIPGLELKRSMGITRGKDDKIDAKRIAQYAYEKRDDLVPYQLPSEEIIQIKRLLSIREKLVKQRAGYMGTLKEYKHFLKRKDNEMLFDVHEKMIAQLSKHIARIETQLDDVIKGDDQIKKMYELITGIKGIGPQTALFIIAFTNGFTQFKNWRKFASYCGIAPFPNRSGISVRGRTKVSNLANKKIKSLLDLCAKTSIQYNMEMKIYYEKRVSEGKSKMSTINIIRNKLLSRVFAVVERETPYVNTVRYFK
ncbi:MAG: IS110 family transposase [Bacteroidetes bacterium RIFOXYB12_FULL_41_6]|nr:MAG: IS110 family transposase [Bacteroidetes bacterium RIFOXYB12_FULL_41_6]